LNEEAAVEGADEDILEDAADSIPIELDAVQGDEDESGLPLPLPEGCGLPVAEGGGVLSPLSGAYLLIVLAEPISEKHKEKMLQKLRQGRVTFTFYVNLNIEANRAKKPLKQMEYCLN